MPQRNSRKIYLEHGFYHVYNRGVEKRTIFDSPQDYNVFLGYIREYLTPPTIEEDNGVVTVKDYHQRKQYADSIHLQSYVLMPNHFHLLIRQKSPEAMKEFLQSLCTRYSMYFNRQYDRVGSLFQGRYKAVMIKTDEQLVHLSRYIHLNPLDLVLNTESLESYPYSSYLNYLGKRNETWLSPTTVLELFNATRSGKSAENQYRRFVEQVARDQKGQADNEVIRYLTIEED